MFKDAVSIPGISVKWKFFDLKDDNSVDIPLISTQNKDLYHTVKENIVGGPSIVFHRHHEKDVTKIREADYGEEAKTCHNVLGCDANALYLWSMMQEMPTGSPIRRRSENGFRPEFVDKYGRMAWCWLELIANIENKHIRHKYNNHEYRVGQHSLPVDGYCKETNTVYQFHGCIFHGHNCHLTNNSDTNPINEKSYVELNKDTKEKEQYIKSLGYNLVTIYECQWLNTLQTDASIASFVSQLQHRSMAKNVPMTEQQIITAMMNDTFFGLIECDISVPDHLKDYFSEMSPIFKNIDIKLENISEHMQEFAKSSGHLKQPQRMLIGSLKGEKILLLTPLAKWYVNHGLKITKIHQIVQYKPIKCFEKFGTSVSDARREGDVDSSKALLAEISKLVGKFFFYIYVLIMFCLLK